ncbi:limbin-like isoform X2 [Trichomycterus rosablanca]|uniref:limbin-like isoform X2 n=1 Tax=Trichomycterus rosablanca TaxID=2290929 RepID=UPI002F35C4D2
MGVAIRLDQVGSTVKASVFDVVFQKCAQVVTGSEVPQVKFYLVIKNSGGTDLSQLSIRDTVSDIISVQTNGNVQDGKNQMFSTDTLPAGSGFVVTYTASVKGNRNEVQHLPAFLSFSNSSQNDVNLFAPVRFGPLMANFTLRSNITEKVCVDHKLHFAWFCVAFLSSTLLLLITLIISTCFHTYCCIHNTHTAQPTRKQSFSEGTEPDEEVFDVSELANQEAAFEDKFIDIMTLEDPQNMLHALNMLEVPVLVRASVMVECVRVRMLEGVFRILMSALGVSSKEVGVVNLLTRVTAMEDQRAQLNPHCNMDTHTELQRDAVLWRREELHSIISEELEEAAMTGETSRANQILHQYYTCQNQLEAVLDVFVANQRAVLSECQAQRGAVVQGLQDLQQSVYNMFSVYSQHISTCSTRIHREGELSDQWCMEQLERAQSKLLRVKHNLEETLTRERSSAHCDIITTRRRRIAETLYQHMCEQQKLGCVGEVEVDQYLQRWQNLLCAQTLHLSELITHLDQEAAAQIRKVWLCVLRDAVLELKQIDSALSKTLEEGGAPRKLLLQLRVGSVVGGVMSEVEAGLGLREKEAAKALRLTRNRIQRIREQELQQQRERRERIHHYYRSVCEGQCALSEKDELCVQLECVKHMCRLDRCLVQGYNIPANQSTAYHPDSSHQNSLTHPQALEEAELQLQKEGSEWEESVDGRGYDKLLSPDCDAELFRVDPECSVTEILQEVLFKRQRLSHTLADRWRMEIRRQQVMEDRREKLELKRLYTHCDQELLLAAVLINLSGVGAPVLQQLLRLLLPTAPEGEIQSLLQTLVSNAGRALGPCSDVVDRLRRDVISRNLSPRSGSYTDRMQKKKQKLQEKLFITPRPSQSRFITVHPTVQEEPAAAAGVVGGARPEGGEDVDHTPTVEEGVVTKGERQEHTQTGAASDVVDPSRPSERRRRRRRVLIKKGTVAPLDQP